MNIESEKKGTLKKAIKTKQDRRPTDSIAAAHPSLNLAKLLYASRIPNFFSVSRTVDIYIYTTSLYGGKLKAQLQSHLWFANGAAVVSSLMCLFASVYLEIILYYQMVCFFRRRCRALVR